MSPYYILLKSVFSWITSSHCLRLNTFLNTLFFPFHLPLIQEFYFVVCIHMHAQTNILL